MAEFTGAICLLLLFCYVPLAVPATNYPFPGNSGQTGLWDMPNARIMPDWNARINFTYTDPYGYWSGNIGLLDRFEFNLRLNEVTNRPGAPGQKHFRDKAADVKFLLLKETDWRPAAVLGATDIVGTGLFTSRYLAFSKRFKFIDVSWGLGQGLLAGEITSRDADAAQDFLFSSPFNKDTSFFAGIEFRITDDLSFVGEYSSYDYEKLFGGLEEKWPVNFGFKYRFADYFLTSLSWQRGEELSFGLGVTIPFNPELLLAWKKGPFYRPPEKVRLGALEAENEVIASLVADQVSMVGFDHVRAASGYDAIWVEFVNNRYLSHQKAMGRVARIVDLTTPPRIKWLYLALVKDGMVVHCWKVHRDLLSAFLEWRLGDEAIWNNSEHEMGGRKLWHEFMARRDATTLREAPRGQEKFRIRIAPKVQTLVNDPAGFFKSAVGVITSLEYQPWKGGLFTTSLRTVLYNNIRSDVKVVEPCPPRSDFVDYLSDSNSRINTLAFDQIVQLPGDVWARGAVGAFEAAYMGVGGELFRFFGDGRFGAGIEAAYVKKRDLDSQFKEKEGCPSFYSAFVNLYYHLWPSQGIDAGLKIGRFLGGDEGVRIDLSRTFKHFTVGAWITLTDTSDFVAEYNRGYEDKGIYFSIPLSAFFDSDIFGRLNYTIRAFTRDPGAIVDQPRHLYPFTDDGNMVHFKEHLKDMRN